MVFQLVRVAEKKWRRLNGSKLLARVIEGVKFVDGVAPNDSAYPMTTTLGIGYLKNRKADVQPLADWLLSEEGQMKLQEFDLIGIRQN